MSLILDALRKSEAERRRGQSPDLFAPTAAAPVRDAGRPRTWPLLLLGAMLLGSAWLIWDSGDDARVAQVAPDEPTATPQVPHADVDADRAAPAAAARAYDAAADVPPGPAAAARTSPGERAPAVRPAQAPTPTPPPLRTATPAQATEPAAPEPALPPPPPADEALAPVAVLDAATRATLPALKLSMHVYADDPARRFAIVDGQRVGEGAVLGGGRVAQIRRDGVVIEVNGRRVLLPKP